uniref:Uncharacterized protein n=1 Tax=Trypanosoma congolense (strain IL3000) TaxID=1068625 RepID=G0UTX4_TRYCI|nr:conserved hypothetical protein [Trypanosoma congolense IL3000]
MHPAATDLRESSARKYEKDSARPAVEGTRSHTTTPRSVWAGSARSDASGKPSVRGMTGTATSSPALSATSGLHLEMEGVEHEKYVLQLLQRASQAIKDERVRSQILKKQLEELRQSGVTPANVENLKKENKKLIDELMFLCGNLSKEDFVRGLSERDDNTVPMETRKNQRRSKSTFASRLSDGTTPQCTTLGASSVGRGATFRKTGGPTGSVPSTTPRCSPLQPSVSRQSSNQKAGTMFRAPETVDNPWAITPIEAGALRYAVKRIKRLRRAMVPQPSKEQLGQVIHAMVEELVRDAYRRGKDLQMHQKAPCVYVCTYSPNRQRKIGSTATRVMHLSIDNGRLTVKMGGGHVNLLDFLEKHCNCRFSCRRRS